MNISHIYFLRLQQLIWRNRFAVLWLTFYLAHQGCARADQTVTENWYAYDSNGNVIMLTNAEAKLTAHYQYDAFGKTLAATGPAAESNTYRFSTKPIEDGSRLAFYGFRYYSPELGRWTARDPIEERGGINLYEIASHGTDVLGLVPFLVGGGAQYAESSSQVWIGVAYDSEKESCFFATESESPQIASGVYQNTSPTSYAGIQFVKGVGLGGTVSVTMICSKESAHKASCDNAQNDEVRYIFVLDSFNMAYSVNPDLKINALLDLRSINRAEGEDLALQRFGKIMRKN